MKKPTIYVNEFDPNAAAWIRELMKMKALPEGEVDERSITDVEPSDITGFTQCHFFAGIGGWLQALILGRIPWDLRLASASLPCQPWSASGLQLGEEDDRHLYPTFHNLVLACRWPLIFGEQVSSSKVVGPVHRPDRLPLRGEEPPVWYSGIRDSLESASYTVGALDIPAPGIGTDCEVGIVRGDSFEWQPGRIGPNHIRQRLYWCAWLADSRRLLHERGLRPLETLRPVGAAEGTRDQRQWSWPDFGRGGEFGAELPESDLLADTNGNGFESRRSSDKSGKGSPKEKTGASVELGRRSMSGIDGLEHGKREGLEGHRGNGRDRNQPRWVDPDEAGSTAEAGRDGDSQLADRNRNGRPEMRGDFAEEELHGAFRDSNACGPSDTDGRHACEERQQRSGQHGLVAADRNLGFWLNSALIPCTDGKARRIESGTFPLAHGIPRGVVPSGDPGDEEYVKATGEARTTRLRGYGNAIVPQLAAEFIQTCMEVITE